MRCSSLSRASRLFATLPSFVGVRRTVRGKLMRVVLITTLIALCVAGIAMLTVDLNRYQQSWASDLTTEASILAVSLAPALAFDDHEAAVRNLSALKARPRVMAAALYAADGSVYASFVRDGALSLPEPVHRRKASVRPANVSNMRSRSRATAKYWERFT